MWSDATEPRRPVERDQDSLASLRGTPKDRAQGSEAASSFHDPTCLHQQPQQNKTGSTKVSGCVFFALCSCCRQSANSINNKKKKNKPQAVKTTTCFRRAAVLSPPESEISLFLSVLKQKSSRFSQAAAERLGKQNPPLQT